MRTHFILIALLGIFEFAGQAGNPDLRREPLSHFDRNRNPWQYLDAEKPYFYMGSTPREMALGLPPQKRPRIFSRLKKIAQRETLRVRKDLKLGQVQFEMYPAQDDWGAYTWVIARYRKDSESPWVWIDESQLEVQGSTRIGPTRAIFPSIMEPEDPESADAIFTLLPKDLYQRPQFECILWMNRDGKSVVTAWQDYSQILQVKKLCPPGKCFAVSLPPPARFNEEPRTFVVETLADNSLKFPSEIEWVAEDMRRATDGPYTKKVKEWPADMKEKYLETLELYTGKRRIVSPLTGRQIDFRKQSSGLKDNQLLDTAAHIRKRHEKLGYGKRPGFEVETSTFMWNGIEQGNVIATIRGSDPSLPPVLATGHYDKAIAEDLYEESDGKERITNPGADDNITAVAALYLMAEMGLERYERTRPKRDILLMYVTGEEFPTGTLGVRQYISDTLLKGKRDIAGNINMDMIGHRTEGDSIFQISPGASQGSWELALLAYRAARALGDEFEPHIRKPWAKNSYITQTDSTIFDWAGFPTILLNEHINLERRLNPYYHQSNDLSEYVDLDYALFQTKVFIETLLTVAER